MEMERDLLREAKMEDQVGSHVVAGFSGSENPSIGPPVYLVLEDTTCHGKPLEKRPVVFRVSSLRVS